MSAIVANCAINLECELTKPVKVQYIGGNMFSMDNAGNTAHVYVYYNGQPQEIVGTISAEVIRADGATVAVTGAMSGNRAYVIFPQAAYAVPGVLSCVIKATEGTTTTTIAAFVTNVYRSSTDTVVDPGQIIPSISALIAAIDAAVGSIPADYSALLAAVAKEYSSSLTYPIVGTVVWYNGELKQNKVAITTAETFDPDKWEAADVGTLANQALFIAKEFPAAVGAVTGTTPLAFEYGYYMSLGDVGATSNKNESMGWCCAFFDTVEGEKITLDATGSTGVARLYGWLDSEGKVIYRSGVSLSGKRTITAPAGAVKGIINNRGLNQPTGFYAYRGTAIVDALAETDDRFSRVSELVPAAKVTQGINGIVNGLTIKTDGDTITVYGVADATRRWCCVNGQNAIKITTSPLAKTLDPGTYYFELTVSGSQPIIGFHGTYSTFSNYFEIVTNEKTSATKVLTEPTMIAFSLIDDRDYGTAENPTIWTLTIKKLSAIDYTAREANQVNANTAAAALAEVATKAPAIIESASGLIAHFTDGADMPIQEITGNFEPQQAGTGDASPENIRPIVGRSSYIFNVTNKNLFGGRRMMEGIKASIPSATIDEDELTVSFPATAAVSAEYPYLTDLCGLTGKFKEHTEYTIWLTIQKSAGLDANIDVVFTDGSSMPIGQVSATGSKKMVVCSTPASNYLTVYGLRLNAVSGTTTIYCNEACGVFEGTLAGSSREKGAMYEIAFPAEAGTVYGGSLKVNADGTGTLTVNRGMYVFDSAEKIAAVGEASTGIMYIQSAGIGSNCVDGDTSLISNQYSIVRNSAPTEGTAIRVNTQGSSGIIYVYDNRFADAETAAAICEANPIQVCYALATPIVYNFTAGQIRSILGENNVWAESGNVTLKYAADTKLYIDNAIANLS